MKRLIIFTGFSGSGKSTIESGMVGKGWAAGCEFDMRCGQREKEVKRSIDMLFSQNEDVVGTCISEKDARDIEQYAKEKHGASVCVCKCEMSR